MARPTHQQMIDTRNARLANQPPTPVQVRAKTACNKRPTSWAYGITTVPSRSTTALPKTIESLARAGFDDPWLFVDGCDNCADYSCFDLSVSCRPNPPMMVARHWILSAWELYLRFPTAQRYTMFQDDILAVKNLRLYLSSMKIEDNTYWNLFTFPENLAATEGKPGWSRAKLHGFGALGLVFSRESFRRMLRGELFVIKPAMAKLNLSTRKIDGGIWQAMKNQQCVELIHNPSLLQHQQGKSTIHNNYRGVESFPGEDFDAMRFL